MQRGSRCNKDQNATRIKMQRGSRCNEDQDATRIRMQRGSRCNEDQDARKIKMQRGSRSRGPNSSTCVLVIKENVVNKLDQICIFLKDKKTMPFSIEDLQNKLKPQSFTDHFDSYSGQIQDFWTKMQHFQFCSKHHIKHRTFFLTMRFFIDV